MILLPGDPGFYETLATPPPDWGKAASRDGDSYAFVVLPGSGGVATAVTLDELDDYIDGDLYDERMAEIEDEDSEADEANDLIWTPLSVA